MTSEIRLIHFWQPNIYIRYTVSITAANGSKLPSSITVDLEVLAYYEFLYAFQKQKPAGSSTPSGTVGSGATATAGSSSANRLTAFLSSLIDADRIMCILFAQVSGTASETMEQLKNQVLSFEQKSKLFWKLLTTLGNSWQKWFKSEKLEVILNPKLNYPKPFQLQFQSTAEQLENFFTQWATFAYEKKLFVKFLSGSSDISSSTASLFPSSFCILQLSWDTPNLLAAQLSFFDAPPKLRSSTFSHLKRELQSFKLVHISCSNNIY